MPRVSIPVRNTLAYAVPELFWGLAWGATLEGPLVAAFSKGFGGSDTFVGHVSLLTALGLGLPMFLSAFWVESLAAQALLRVLVARRQAASCCFAVVAAPADRRPRRQRPGSRASPTSSA